MRSAALLRPSFWRSAAGSSERLATGPSDKSWPTMRASRGGSGGLAGAGRPNAHARMKGTNRRRAAFPRCSRRPLGRKKYLDISFRQIFEIYNTPRVFHQSIIVRPARVRATETSGVDKTACPQLFPRTRRFTAISSRLVACRPTVSLRRSVRSAGWCPRLGVDCPRLRLGRPSTRVRPRLRRPAAARRRRRKG